MTAPEPAGLLGVFGPLAEPVRRMELGPYRCGCNVTYGQSCSRCDGTSADEWEVERAAREEQQKRERLMRNPAYRAAWLDTFAEPLRSLMAADAERRFGPIPDTTDQRRSA